MWNEILFFYPNSCFNSCLVTRITENICTDSKADGWSQHKCQNFSDDPGCNSLKKSCDPTLFIDFFCRCKDTTVIIKVFIFLGKIKWWSEFTYVYFCSLPMNWAIVRTAITWKGWLAIIDAVVAVTLRQSVNAKVANVSSTTASSFSSSSSPVNGSLFL